MKDYIANENFKFILSIIIFLVVGFTIYGLVFGYWDKKEQEFYSSAYSKGYDDGINHREFDDSYESPEFEPANY